VIAPDLEEQPQSLKQHHEVTAPVLEEQPQQQQQPESSSRSQLIHVVSPYHSRTKNYFYPLDSTQWPMLVSLQHAQAEYMKWKEESSAQKFDSVIVVCAVTAADYDALHDVLTRYCQHTTVLPRTTSTEYPQLLSKDLPFFRDILEAGIGVAASDNYHLVFTNSDICLSKSFYIEVDSALESPDQVLFINRKTVRDVNVSELKLEEREGYFRAKHQAAKEIVAHGHFSIDSGDWTVHPGVDCFVMHSSILKKIDLGGDMFVGYPPFDFNFRLSLQVMTGSGGSSILHSNMLSGGTFHFGDDMSWREKSLSEEAVWNALGADVNYLTWCPIVALPPKNAETLLNAVACGKWFHPRDGGSIVPRFVKDGFEKDYFNNYAALLDYSETGMPFTKRTMGSTPEERLEWVADFSRRFGSSPVVTQERSPVPHDQLDSLRTLAETEEVWARLVTNEHGRKDEIVAAAKADAEFKTMLANEEFEPINVCGRPAKIGAQYDYPSLLTGSSCPEVSMDRPLLFIEPGGRYGRTGNNLVSFLHALQMARDTGSQLSTMNGWLTRVMKDMWMASNPEMNFEELFERSFCIKLFDIMPRMDDGWSDIKVVTGKELFFYTQQPDVPLSDYMTTQTFALRTLFLNYNDGSRNTRDMCSGVRSLFGAVDEQSLAADSLYTVIHIRHLEGEAGVKLLGYVAHTTGCDKSAALYMEPEYVKSVLGPLGMLSHPIVLIHDGENLEAIERLRNDPVTGPLVKLVPEGVGWLGGDIALAATASVFIGNPASTLSMLITKIRLSLGFAHNELFKAKDEEGNWKTVCGDHCVFDNTVMFSCA